MNQIPHHYYIFTVKRTKNGKVSEKDINKYYSAFSLMPDIICKKPLFKREVGNLQSIVLEIAENYLTYIKKETRGEKFNPYRFDLYFTFKAPYDANIHDGFFTSTADPLPKEEHQQFFDYLNHWLEYKCKDMELFDNENRFFPPTNIFNKRRIFSD